MGKEQKKKVRMKNWEKIITEANKKSKRKEEAETGEMREIKKQTKQE